MLSPTRLEPPPGFVLPDPSPPMDAGVEIARIRPESTHKGMFLNGVLDHLKREGKSLAGRSGYISFKSYPTTEFAQLLVDAAPILAPHVPLRDGLRLLGRSAYPALVASTVGRVIFGVLGKDIASLTPLASKAYEIAGTHGRCTVLEASARHSLVRLEDIQVFADTYQVGVFEGVIDACEREGEVWLKRHSPTAVELYSTWR